MCFEPARRSPRQVLRIVQSVPLSGSSWTVGSSRPLSGARADGTKWNKGAFAALQRGRLWLPHQDLVVGARPVSSGGTEAELGMGTVTAVVGRREHHALQPIGVGVCAFDAVPSSRRVETGRAVESAAAVIDESGRDPQEVATVEILGFGLTVVGESEALRRAWVGSGRDRDLEDVSIDAVRRRGKPIARADRRVQTVAGPNGGRSVAGLVQPNGALMCRSGGSE